MMTPFKLTVDMVSFTCCRCGIPYAMPAGFIDDRRKNHRKICCPNGHVARYAKPATAAADGEQLRAVHDREQAEAKIADLQAQLAAAGRPAPATRDDDDDDDGGPDDIQAPAPPAVAANTITLGGGIFDPHRECPKCGRPYRSRMAWGKHLRKVHGLDPVKVYRESVHEQEQP